MADYPSTLPVLTDEVGSASDPLNSPSLPAWALHISQEVEAIAAELGTSPSAAYATVKARLDDLQPLDSDLTDLASRWSAASSSGPAQLAFREDTDNGTNQAVVKAPASMAADRTLTLPDETGTLVTLVGGTFTGDVSVPDEAYGSGWNGSAEVPTKNAVYDKIEAVTSTIWLPPPIFGATLNTPALSVWNSRMEVWLFDAATIEVVGTSQLLPADWATFAVDLLWANAGAGAGNVVWRIATGFLTAGEDASTAGIYTSSSTTTATAGANNILVATTQIGGANVTVSSGQMLSLRVIREAGDAADTLGNDCALLGVTLRKVT